MKRCPRDFDLGMRLVEPASHFGHSGFMPLFLWFRKNLVPVYFLFRQNEQLIEPFAAETKRISKEKRPDLPSFQKIQHCDRELEDKPAAPGNEIRVLP